MSDKLEPMDVDDGYVATVVDLAGFRIQAGRPPAKSTPCQHKNMIYSMQERRVWCEDCNRTIDNFDALKQVIIELDNMMSEARSKLAQADAALRSSVRRRASKELDRAWSGSMVPCCPHCRRGLLPDDFVDGGTGSISKSLEIARRRREQERQPK